MPIETKNIAIKLSLNGIISAVTWCEYSDSDIKSPATKAPKASEKPSSDTISATLKQRNKTEIMNRSRILDFAIKNKSGGTSFLEAQTTKINIKDELRSLTRKLIGLKLLLRNKGIKGVIKMATKS